MMLDRIFINKYDAHVENERFHKGFSSYLKGEDKSESTILNYLLDIKDWLEFLKLDNMRVIDCYEEDLEEYLFFTLENGASVENIKRKFSAIKKFYTYLFECGWVQENPVSHLRKSKMRVFENSYRFINLRQLIELRKKTSGRSKQWKSAVGLMISSGVKMHCISELKWEQVDFINKSIKNVYERPDKVIQVFFDDYTCTALKELKEERTSRAIESEYIFLNVNSTMRVTQRKVTNQEIRKYASEVGNLFKMKNFTPYDLRRSFVNIMYEKGLMTDEINVLLNYRCDKASVLYEQVDVNRILDKKNSVSEYIK